MLILGAGGHAEEILSILLEINATDNYVFFDEINSELPISLSKHQHIKTPVEISEIFLSDPWFIVAVGNPQVRMSLWNVAIEAGGKPYSAISSYAMIGAENSLGEGLNIMHGAVITSGAVIGRGSLINACSSIHHGCQLGSFVEVSPGARLLGKVVVGDNSFIGANAVVLPSIKIGSNVVIGAGAVVTKDIPNNSMAYGVPARIIKTKES